jgi:hypothetical protein
MICTGSRDQTTIFRTDFHGRGCVLQLVVLHQLSLDVPRIQSAEFGLGVEDLRPRSVLKRYRELPPAAGAESITMFAHTTANSDLKQFVIRGLGGNGTLSSCRRDQPHGLEQLP